MPPATARARRCRALPLHACNLVELAMSKATPDPGRPRAEEPLPGPIPSRRAFRCRVCGAEFVSLEQLSEHERAEHHVP